MERFLEKPNAEELRVIATDCITIDADLKNTHWHGKNIVMLTDAIIVTKPVTFDVSGKKNDHVYPEDAGTDKGGDGMQGKDGYPGESGGNVLILANSIENARNLTIVSNGGDGSNGQNGGPGRDGENGTGIGLNLQKLKYGRCSEWMTLMNVKYNSSNDKRNISQLVEMIMCNANSFELVKKNIERSIIEINERNYEIKKNIPVKFKGIVNFQSNTKMVHKFTENDIRMWAKYFSAREYKTEVGDLQEMLAVIDRAVVLKRGFNLRDTQKLAVLTLLANGRSILAQVSTGEGKSLIVVAAAIMKALFGEKVDIVTSSSVLAKRDAENNNDIYSLFGITVSHNCSEDTEKRREAYVLCQVVYGDLGSFQRDYLLDRFYGKNILGDRDFTNVIVDEVDSMLVDKGNNMLYLSHDIPWMDKLESVYLFIWQRINRPEQIVYSFDLEVKCIEAAVLSDLYGMIREQDIAKIDVTLSDRDCKVIWLELVNSKMLDERGRLLIESLDGLKISESLTPEFSRYTDRISFLLQATIDRERVVLVPNHLRSFVERHLKQWIKSGITAFFMNPGHDYVVDVDRTGTSSDRNANIIILDKDTGTDQANSQWDEALHQFLQLKHGCKLSMLSLKAVFISNVSYFKLYRQLYGLTGTLGSETELDLLREIHNVDFVTIPTSYVKQFQEVAPFICCDREEWIKSVCNQAQLVTGVEKRSVLIICATVKDVLILHKALGGKEATHVHCYVRDYEEFAIAKGDKKLDQGQIIVATNLAGRGTDIQITDALRNAGGLHVLLTYLPGNKRIEEQAFGRAARSGDKGSGQIIVEYSKDAKSTIFDMKTERDTGEVLRVSEIKRYYHNRIIAEERYFQVFKNQYEQLKKKLNYNQIPDELEEILMKSCLDRWAFWLDNHSETLTAGEDGYKDESFDRLISHFKQLYRGLLTQAKTIQPVTWIPWVEGIPAQMVKLAKYLSQQKSGTYKDLSGTCIRLYENVIRSEPFFSEAAHYYKAFAIAKQIDWAQKPLDSINITLIRQFQRELRAAGTLFETHSQLATTAAASITNLILHVGERCLRVNGYGEQKKHVADLYSRFVRSIDDILGHHITPESFENHEVEFHMAECLFKDLLKAGILLKATVEKKNISQKNLRTVGQAYGISAKRLERFLTQYTTHIHGEKFEKDLEQAIELPGREHFWKILTTQGVLHGTISYVIVDQAKMDTVDPSLLHFLRQRVQENELKTETIECTSKQIVLYGESVSSLSDREFVFVKEKFIETVGRTKYQFLQEHKVVSFNKKASVDATKLQSASLPCFDSITVEDFVEKTIISRMEAETILSELVQHQILRKHRHQAGSYALAINFDEMPYDQVLSCTAYEPTVRNLLSVCFSYRLVLQKLIRQVAEKATPIRLELLSRPHRSLVFYLLEQKLVNPIKVMKGDIDHEYKKSLKQSYTNQELHMLLNAGEVGASLNVIKTFERLSLLQWIVPKPDHRYSISDASKRRALRNIILDVGEGASKRSYDSYETVEKRFDNRLKLTKDDVVFKHVVERLNSLRGSLHTRKVPEVAFTSLLDCNDIEHHVNVEEVRLFFINGMDQLVHLEEQKWTKEMLVNTGIVVAMGIAQFAIGAAVELCFAGILAHGGIALINEGINDLIYATTAFHSGYFSWQDYGKYKLQSVCLMVATAGVSSLLSRVNQLPRFGFKLIGPSLNALAGPIVSAQQVAGTVGVPTVARQIATHVLRKTTLSVTETVVDTMAERYLQSQCNLLERDCLAKTMDKINKHPVLNTLKRSYDALGEEDAWTLVSSATNSTYEAQRRVVEYLANTRHTMTVAISGKTEAQPVGALSKAVSLRERSIELSRVCRYADDLLYSLNILMKTKLDLTKPLARQPLEEKGTKGYAIFQKKVITLWEELFKKSIGDVISQGDVYATRKESTNVERSYIRYSNKNTEYDVRLKELKQQHKEKLERERRDEESLTSLVNHTQKYHQDLLRLMYKTRNPSLLAAIIRENVPMNFMCASACTFLACNLVLRRGVSLSAKVVIEGENGLRVTFSVAPTGVTDRAINIRIQDNLYEVSGSGGNSCFSSSGPCLLNALATAIPEFHIVGDFTTDD
ncbi:LOW QUALITY PROTEIN: uncharacterized protein LOC131285440 [Anopheles ziemanni]|uniref:LOW QUALITY PROTEIN: uncharacterized protein LOC131266465 n=1 Tax=Anopheles coustani TaxID=139045 RepID=UPI002659617D|nr:LOW QUALITY PROTEIN: uncharacterized protein LOC131266465 [Anopheles coustani]XP_058170278.1 LOW QUALITY PROTEIN: uncharacterized protein LOC131285440 [Anopheles ziemanni]